MADFRETPKTVDRTVEGLKRAESGGKKSFQKTKKVKASKSTSVSVNKLNKSVLVAKVFMFVVLLGAVAFATWYGFKLYAPGV